MVDTEARIFAASRDSPVGILSTASSVPGTVKPTQLSLWNTTIATSAYRLFPPGSGVALPKLSTGGSGSPSACVQWKGSSGLTVDGSMCTGPYTAWKIDRAS